MSWLSDIGDAFSSVVSPIASIAPQIGSTLGGFLGGPEGSAIGGNIGNIAKGFFGGGGGGGSQQRAPQQQPQYGSSISPESYSTAPTPSPNIAGMPGVTGWPQYQPSNYGQGGYGQGGGQGYGGGGPSPFSPYINQMGQRGGDYLNNQIQSFVPQQYQNMTMSQMPGAFGNYLGQKAASYLPQSMQSFGPQIANFGQSVGDSLGRRFGDYIPSSFQNVPIGQMGSAAAQYGSNFLNNQINSRFGYDQPQQQSPYSFQPMMYGSQSGMPPMIGNGGEANTGGLISDANFETQVEPTFSRYARGGHVNRPRREMFEYMGGGSMPAYAYA